MPNAEKLDELMRERLLTAQRNELTEYHIYLGLAKATRDAHNSDILRQIADDERRHYDFWREFTEEDVEPDWIKVRWYLLLARVLGLTFSIKLMERGEEQAQDVYTRISGVIPESQRIVEDEDNHEDQLIAMLDEERLRYVGSMVLGLNDALVELTGTLAGLTLALQNTRLIGAAGLITGIAASLSMAASEYLSTKSEETGQDPLKAALYTGSAYVLTVALLILPYFLFASYMAALGVTVLIALLIILFFTFYIGVAKDLPFKRRFLEMAALSFGVAALSFVIGFLVREFLGVDV